MMTRPRTQYILPAMLVSVLAVLIFSDVGNAQDAQSETGTVRGAVATTAPDGQSYNIPAASLKLKRGTQVAETTANDAGEYEFTKLLPGEYTLEATAEGFKASSKTITIRAGETLVENVSLEVADVTASVTVDLRRSQNVQTTETAPASTVKQNTLQTLPLPNEQLLDALPLVPGVVRGPDGQIDMNGARASQSSMTVNSANVTDPVTGQFAFNLPIEAVESVQVLTNPYAAEYGKFTGGVTAVATRSGTDKFNVEAQSFFPRFRRRGDKWSWNRSIHSAAGVQWSNQKETNCGSCNHSNIVSSARPSRVCHLTSAIQVLRVSIRSRRWIGTSTPGTISPAPFHCFPRSSGLSDSTLSIRRKSRRTTNSEVSSGV